MERRALKNPYLHILRSNGLSAYGGDQGASDDKVMQRCGCGVVGCVDLLLYLQRWKEGIDMPFLRDVARDRLPMEEYQRLAQELRKKYFFLVYPFGKDGVTMALGLNRIFRKNGVPLRARWNLGKRSLWSNLERMLGEDIPVILSIGPNFPLFWQKHRLNLYYQDASGALHPAAATNSHFLMVTAIDGDRLTVSSWGAKYVILRQEYCDFVSRRSCWLFSNILWVRKVQKGKV